MQTRQVVTATGVGAAILGGVAMFGSHQVHAYGVSLNPTVDSLAQWLFAGGGLAAILGYASKFVPALGGTAVPELLAALTAWLANKSDKNLQRRFVLAVLAELSELSKDRPDIQKLVSDLGHSLVDSWLPSVPVAEAK